jgi:hypothetical protein
MPAFRLEPRECAQARAGAIARMRRARVVAGVVTALALAFSARTQALVATSRADDPYKQVAELRPQANRTEPRFGRSVALLGKAALVASPPTGDTSSAGGAVHVFQESRSGWRRVQRIDSPDPKAEDRFGQSLAVQGTWLVVGRDRADDAGSDTGALSVFRKVGLHYRFEATLLAEKPDPGDGFGACVAVDRDRIAGGTPRDDDLALDAGSVTTFERRNDEWLRTAHLLSPDGAASDWFGCAVALGGERLAVGAYGDDDHGEKSGAAYVWRRSEERDRAWEFEAKFAPDDLAAGDWFGFSCALSSGFLAIGAPRDDDAGESAGCVRVYRRSHDEWVLDATLRPPDGSVTTWFGYALSLDERRLIVGAPGDDAAGEASGAAYCYTRGSDGWRLVATLRPSGAETEFQCGAAVALDERRAILGRLWAEDGEVKPGHAWVFEYVERPSTGGDSTGPAAAPATTPPPTDRPGAGVSSRDRPAGAYASSRDVRTCVGVRGPSP